MKEGLIQMDATLSECGTYRYTLSRPRQELISQGPPAVFVMLNPSTADANQDDPTIRRCRGFARDWGCAGIVVVNLFALRATDPAEIPDHPDPEGPDNDRWLRHIAAQYEDLVVAWGANAPEQRVEQVRSILTEHNANLWCLGTTQSGAPRHPLYVPRDRTLQPWPA